MPKKSSKRAQKKATKAVQDASAMRRAKTREEFGTQSPQDRMIERNRPEDVNQAAARIVREATED